MTSPVVAVVAPLHDSYVEAIFTVQMLLQKPCQTTSSKSVIYQVYPYSVWSCGVPKSPRQLLGSRHCVIGLSSIFVATDVRYPASGLLSPSMTNWRTEAVGMGQSVGMDNKSRRVRPPPGMKGISESGVEACVVDIGCAGEV